MRGDTTPTPTDGSVNNDSTPTGVSGPVQTSDDIGTKSVRDYRSP